MSRFTGDGGLRKSKRSARRHTGRRGCHLARGPLAASHACAHQPFACPVGHALPGPPPSVQPAVIRRPVAQVLTPSPGLSPPCRGQRENSGQSVCASSFLGRPLGSPGQVRRLGPQHSACKTAGKAVSGGRLSGCAWPRPGLGTKCLVSWETLSPGQTGVVGRPKPTHPAPPFR